jgi:hypothetical protein
MSQANALTDPDQRLAEVAAPERFGIVAHLAGFLERNVFLALVFGVCITAHTLVARSVVADDTWYSLAAGRMIVHSWLPHHDHWMAMSAGRTWVDEQWLAQLGLYGLWAAGGFSLLVTVSLALFVGAFLVVAFAARRAGASDRAVAIVTLLGYVVGISNSVVRAQSPTFFLFALIVVLLVADARAASRRVFLVLPLLVLWANMHGSVVLGAGIVALRGLTVAGAGLRHRVPPSAWALRAAALALLPWACTLASPYGTELVHYYRITVGNANLARTASEWGPTTIRLAPVFVLLLLLGFWLLGRTRGVLTAFEQLAVVATGLSGLYALRYMVWFGLVAVCVLPRALDAAWRPRAARRNRRLNIVLAGGALGVAAVAAIALAARHEGWFQRGFPRPALAALSTALRSDPRLRVYSNEKYADWLLFEDPALQGRIAYDARFELLDGTQLDRIIRFRNQAGVDWQRAASGYGLLVLDPGAEQRTIRFYERRPGSKVLYSGPKVAVIRRAENG